MAKDARSKGRQTAKPVKSLRIEDLRALVPAVAYIRMSTDKQEESPEQQRREIIAMAEKLGYEILRWYEDLGVSGDDTERRLAFLKMRSDAETLGDFSAVLCWDQDRFGRFDSIEAGYWIRPLRKKGISLVTVAQGVIDWDSFAGRVMYGIQQEGKNQFLHDSSRNICRAKRDGMRDKKCPPSPVYGYDRVFFDEKGTLVRRVPFGEKFHKPKNWSASLSPATDGSAENVRWIHTYFGESGAGIRSIISNLNTRGIPSPRNKGSWNWATIHYILTNPVYTGMRTYGRHSSGKYHIVDDRGEVSKVRGPRKRVTREQPLYYAEDQHEPLVDAHLFITNQHKLQERKRSKQRTRVSPYLLTGILFCGHCGGKMYGGRAKTNLNGTVIRYYACSTGDKQGSSRCKNYLIRKDRIEQFVLSVVHNVMLVPEFESRVRQSIVRMIQQPKKQRTTSHALRHKLQSLDKKIKAVADALKTDELSSLVNQLTGWAQERTALVSQLQSSTRDTIEPDRLANEAIGRWPDLHCCLRTEYPLRVREIVRSVLSRIALWWEPRPPQGIRRRLSRRVIEFAGHAAEAFPEADWRKGLWTDPEMPPLEVVRTPILTNRLADLVAGLLLEVATRELETEAAQSAKSKRSGRPKNS